MCANFNHQAKIKSGDKILNTIKVISSLSIGLFCPVLSSPVLPCLFC